MDAAKITDELRAEQEHSANLERAKKANESHIKVSSNMTTPLTLYQKWLWRHQQNLGSSKSIGWSWGQPDEGRQESHR